MLSAESGSLSRFSSSLLLVLQECSPLAQELVKKNFSALLFLLGMVKDVILITVYCLFVVLFSVLFLKFI